MPRVRTTHAPLVPHEAQGIVHVTGQQRCLDHLGKLGMRIVKLMISVHRAQKLAGHFVITSGQPCPCYQKSIFYL
ncbi:MAG: hypothetical protein Q8N91_00370, partial [Candidatus Omnitrophota bacterium]|nr:hypothetical protein [Candidatus Omnitrophota bacterium]